MKSRWFFAILAAAAVLTVGLMTSGPASAQQGTMKETPEFKILVPNGWDFFDFGKGSLQVATKSGSYMVSLKKEGVNMTEKDVEHNITSLAKQYKGTGPDKTTINGLSFFKTTYDASSTHQTMYCALKDGSQIQIVLLGKDHETDPTIQAVFKSIAWK